MTSAADEREPARREAARALRAQMIEAGLIAPGERELVTRFHNADGLPLIPLDNTARLAAEQHLREGDFGRRTVEIDEARQRFDPLPRQRHRHKRKAARRAECKRMVNG